MADHAVTPKIVEKIAPFFAAQLDEHYDELISSFPEPVQWALKKYHDTLVAKVPTMTGKGANALLDAHGAKTVEQVVEKIFT